jgi:hypothetical protein
VLLNIGLVESPKSGMTHSQSGVNRIEKYLVEPHIGVLPVRLNMQREDVHLTMGKDYESYYPCPDKLIDAYHKSGFQISYTPDFLVEYIELNHILKTTHDIICLGQNIFKTPANQIIDIISKEYPFDDGNPEMPYSYLFPQIDLSFWRPLLSEDGTEEGVFFTTIGIGIQGYYSQIIANHIIG